MEGVPVEPLFAVLCAFLEPVQVSSRASGDRQGDEFGDFVAVEAFHFPFKAAQLSCRGFDQEQEFARLFYFTLPAIMGLDRAAEDADTGGEAFFDDAAGNEFGLDGIGAGHEHEPVLFVRLHVVLSANSF